eukprot:1183651-Prorocentrum_minimum.AAC.1
MESCRKIGGRIEFSSGRQLQALLVAVVVLPGRVHIIHEEHDPTAGRRAVRVGAAPHEARLKHGLQVADAQLCGEGHTHRPDGHLPLDLAVVVGVPGVVHLHVLLLDLRGQAHKVRVRKQKKLRVLTTFTYEEGELTPLSGEFTPGSSAGRGSS